MAKSISAEQFMREKDAQWQKRETFVTIDESRLGHSFWRRVAWTFHQQHNMTDKVFVIERLQLTSAEPTSSQSAPDLSLIGAIQYRIGYWIVYTNGVWGWGRNSPLVPIEDFEPLLAKARQAGTILPS